LEKIRHVTNAASLAQNLIALAKSMPGYGVLAFA
jgi:hypothetical protein